MKRWDDASAASWTAAADDNNSRLLNPGFEGVVIAVQGSAGKYQVQVVKAAETRSDGMWYDVQANGTIPQIGDRIQLQWISKRTAVASGLIDQPRVAPAHSYLCRAYWTGSTAVNIGWTFIPYNNASSDPSGMLQSGSIVIPLDGWYDVIVKVGGAATAPSLEVAPGIWRVPGGVGSGSQIDQGTDVPQYSGGFGLDMISVDCWPLSKGDYIQGYVYTNINATPLSSGSMFNYIVVALRTQ